MTTTILAAGFLAQTVTSTELGDDLFGMKKDGYLSKPVQAAKLFAAIERQIEANRGLSRLERPGNGDGQVVADPLA